MICDRYKPALPKFNKRRKVTPVVVSAKRLQGMLYRSTMGVKRDKLAQANEEERYLQYLKEGHEALYKRFTNVGVHSLDEEKQAKLDQELREAEIREKQVRMEDERTRKERIIRANRILEDLKAGQRSLHHALVTSDMMYQRQRDTAINREIQEDAERQNRFDELQCPETLLPACKLTDEELTAQTQARAIETRAYFLKDMEERRQRKLEQREQEVYEGIVEREQYKCLYEEEKKKAKKLVEKRKEFCQRAYEEALKDKAEVAKYENICEQIDDRILCVDVTKRRNMDKRHNDHYKGMQQKLINDRQDRAIKICRLQQAAKRELQQRKDEQVESYNLNEQVDEARRQCRIEKLSRERRAYQLVEQEKAKKQRELKSEIYRFEMAARMKNQEANKRFYISQKRRKDKATADLRDILMGQREEFLEKQHEEKMRMSACEADPYLQEDLNFISDAAKTVTKARDEGRPIYPIAKAVEVYRHQNQLDAEPESNMVQRSKLRDYCWPGFHSKADLAYRQYEHRDECRKKQQADRDRMFANCLKITKIAAKENPFKPCVLSCPVKCFQHAGMPPIDTSDSFDVCRHVCYDDDIPVGACPSHMQVIKPCKSETHKNSRECGGKDNCSEAKQSPIGELCKSKTPKNSRECGKKADCSNAKQSPSSELIGSKAGDPPLIQVLSKIKGLVPSVSYRISRTDRTRIWR